MTDDTRTTHKAIADWTGDIVALVSHVEEARESLGYMICAVATAVALIGARSLARNGGATADSAALT